MAAENMIKRVKKEVEIHSRLKHPSILEVSYACSTYRRMYNINVFVKLNFYCILYVDIVTLLKLIYVPSYTITLKMKRMCTWCWKCVTTASFTAISKQTVPCCKRMKRGII